ncbi:unnamed protein product [Blepharisma stoltei]|uniref:Uncharacterized protein n=1 Tax=Blepharisma stoltei TaxID=1481888 RepID=A0AAU9I9H3_9CILI|nr:unnamed protein product [Blepharisma stoltei]
MADKKKISNGSIHVSNCEEAELIDRLSGTINRGEALKYYNRKNQKRQTLTHINMNDLTTSEVCNTDKIYQRSLSNISLDKQSHHFSLEEDNNLRPSIQRTRKNMELHNSLYSNSSQSTSYNNQTEKLKDLIIELLSENIKLKRKCKNHQYGKKIEDNNKPCKNLNLYSFVRDFKTGSHLRVNQISRRKNKLN